MIDTDQLSGSKELTGTPWLFFTPDELEALPPEHRDQLFYLDKESMAKAYEIANNYDILCGDDDWGNQPFSGGCYESVEKLKAWGSDEDMKKWLYERGVAFQSEVILLPVFKTENEPIILTTWKMVVKYAPTFFSFDNLIVLDPALKWCLYYHHDEILTFAKGRRFN